MVMNIEGEPPEMSREMGMQAASFACEPEAVADVIAFLASDDARHINGAGIRVDNTSRSTRPIGRRERYTGFFRENGVGHGRRGSYWPRNL